MSRKAWPAVAVAVFLATADPPTSQLVPGGLETKTPGWAAFAEIWPDHLGYSFSVSPSLRAPLISGDQARRSEMEDV